MNFQMPNMPKFDNPLEAKHDCENFKYCSQLNITTSDCLHGATITRRCNQGQWSNIQLLSQLIQTLHHDK